MSPAKRRRAYGTGGVTQRKDGYWIGRYEAGYTPTGARRRRTVTGRTKAEAERRLTEAVRKVALEGLTNEHDTRATVKTWATTWLPRHADDVRPNSYTTDAGAIRKWVIPTIGHKRLTSLTPADIRAIRSAIVNSGLTTTTARQAQSATFTMLKAARLEGHAIPDRIFDVELAPVALNDRDIIPIEDARAILTASPDDPRETARWALALLAGLRPGEACGLRWADVDLEQQTVTVEWQRQELPYIDRRNKHLGFRVPAVYEVIQLHGSYHLTRPKNKRGLRVVPLVPAAVKALQEWQAVAPHNPWGLVFTDLDQRRGRDDVQTVRSKKVDARHWIEVQDRAQVAHVRGDQGRRYIGYEARHTCATLLAVANVPASIRELIVGHSAAVAARSYLHIQTEDSRSGLTLATEGLTQITDG